MYVNKQFYDIISDTYLWKKRVIRKFNDCDVAFMMTNTYNGETNQLAVVVCWYKKYILVFLVSVSQRIHLIGSNLPGIQN